MDFKKFQNITFFALLGGIGFLFLWMVYPYLFAVFWAAVIAALFHPLYKRILNRVGREDVSAGLTVLIVIIVVVAPLSGVLGLIIKQAVDTYTWISNPETIILINDKIQTFLAIPVVQDVITRIDLREKLESVSATVGSRGVQWLKVGSQSTLIALINVFIMLYTLYYLFKEGERWLRRAMHLLPFGDENEKILYEKFVSTSKATLKGTFLIGGIQGILGGIIFAVAGIPSAAFWGLVMVLFAIIPAVGPVVVWVPGAAFLLVSGNIMGAVIVVIGGVLIGVVDNLLRPPLVGKDIEMHPLTILFSTLGGIGLFGISGVVMGPLIAAFFSAVIQMYETKYKRQLNSKST